MAANTSTTPSLILSEAEAEALALFDQLQRLQLELALLRSQQDHQTSGQSSRNPRMIVSEREPVMLTIQLESGASRAAEHDLAGVQTRLLEAKATLALRNSVVESVVAVQPTLNAVHDAIHASPVER